MQVKRHDLDERTFVTDNGQECCNPGIPGLWVYNLSNRTPKHCDIVGQCATCHVVIAFRINLEWPDIIDIKTRHAYVVNPERDLTTS